MLLFWFLVTASSVYLTHGNVCPMIGSFVNWIFDGEKCVKDFNYRIPLSWYGAREQCKRHGWDLYMPKKESDFTELRGRLNTDQHYWIGIKYYSKSVDNRYRYATGESMTSLGLGFFRPPDKNSFQDEECLRLVNVGGWLSETSRECTRHDFKAYICEASVCTGVGWTWHIDRCIYYDRTPRTFRGALKNCESEGGKILNPDDRFMDQLDKDKLHSGQWRMNIKQFDSVWFYKTPRKQVSKTFMSRMSGNNVSSSATRYCGLLNAETNKWHGEDCRLEAYSICEKKSILISSSTT